MGKRVSREITMIKKLELVPAIDLKDGKCVQLVSGDFNKQKVTIDDYIGVAKKFLDQGVKRLHIVDLNAAKAQGNNIEQIKEIVKISSVPVEVVEELDQLNMLKN